MHARSGKTPEPTSLKKRSATGFIIAAVVSLTVLYGAVPFVFLLLFINSLALMEYQNLMHRLGYFPQKISCQITGLLLLLASWLFVHKIYPSSLFLFLAPFLFLPFFIELFRNSATPFQNIAFTILGSVWISLPLSLFLLAAFLPFKTSLYQSFLPLGYFTILWLGDSGAYFVGKLAGKHTLFYRISPKKTWEGALGGLVLAEVAGYLNFKFFNHLQLHHWLLLALIINVTGTFGDFTKSLLKRSVGVKDAGTLLPGHGGILDRFDSLIGSAPFAFIYLWLYV